VGVEMNTIDKILISCAIAVIVFTVTMIVIFCIFQAIPDSLVECFYSLFTGEIVITFFIWWIKKKASTKGDKHGQTEK
jgi:Fe2+ transport system protein B